MNHFIEIGYSTTTGDYWLTVHTGSRNFGLKIANYHQKQAVIKLKKRRESVVKDKLKAAQATGLEPRDIAGWLKVEYAKIPATHRGLEYLEGEDALEYYWDMLLAQKFAQLNRQIILDNILKVIGTPVYKEERKMVESVHNYIDFNDMIVRKGAISSYIGQLMVIPFNMRDGILICEGKSNEAWNYSAPHGAGRVLSRSAANRILDLETFKNQMEGICSSSVVKSTLDESPDAYKDPKIIEAAIAPTATIVDRLKPVLNIKAT